MDPGWQMRIRATLGPVDFITGDWLAENNIAQEAVAMDKGTGEGFEKKLLGRIIVKHGCYRAERH